MASVGCSGGGIVGREMTTVWESSKDFPAVANTTTKNVSPPSPPSPPSTPPPPPRQRVSDKDTCFRCKRQGHWAADCPTKKSPKNSRASSPGSSGSESGPPLPVVQCPCGGGGCNIVVSRTSKNPDRKFFRCPHGPPPKGCGFFKWCDDVRAPPCPCKAGLCSYNKDPPSGRWYFACRIPKDFGACGFYQWADLPGQTSMSRHVDQSKGQSSPQSPHAIQQLFNHATNESGNEMELSSEMELDSHNVECSEGSECVPPVVDYSTTLSDRDIVKNVSCWVPMFEEVLCQRQTKFLSKDSFEGRILTEGVIYQISRLHLHGWMGGIAFPPLPSLKDADMSAIETPPCLPQVQTPREETQLSPAVSCEPPEPGNPPSHTVAAKDVSVLIMKNFGEALIKTLEDIKPHDHEEMLKAAEVAFKIFDHLSVEYGHFSEAVKEYINCSSSLAQIDESMGGDVSSEELLDIYNCEKLQLDDFCRMHDKILDDYEKSETRLRSLSEEVLHAKDRLHQLQTELLDCEAETLELRARIEEISYKKSESERKIKIVTEYLELEQKREATLDAAKGALKIGKIQPQ